MPASKQMFVLKFGEDILFDQADIKSHVLQFYQQLYASNNVCYIPQFVLKSYVFYMNDLGTLDSDGIDGSFFQKN